MIGLNEPQRQAVEHDGGPLMVLAGAGSGKTRVLTSRLACLVEVQGIAPYRIMAVTFTNRAAGEMRRRVGELLGYDPAGLWIGTFHSIAARLLRREAELLGFTPQFTIYDETDRLALVKRLLERGNFSSKAFPPRTIQWLISNAKNAMLTPDELEQAAADERERVAAWVYREMTGALKAANAMDFDDLLLHPLTLFREHPDRLERYRNTFQSILVDEFQDTNRAQYLMVRELAARSRDLCVVGDDDQSIYGWRGADVRNMLDFQQDFPDVRVIRLEENYRSTSIILDAANALIAENRERLGKTLFTSRSGGEPVIVAQTADERDEAEWVAREIRTRMAEQSYDYGDFAILYRTNAQSRAFEDVFRRGAIPYRVVGAVSFYNRREIKDLLAYLRLIVNPADDESFLRAVSVPRRGVGQTSLAALVDAATRWNRPLLETAGIADRVPNLTTRPRQSLREFVALLERLREDARHHDPAAVLESVIEAIDYESYLHGEGPDGTERMENVRELLAGAAEWSEEIDPDDPSTPLERYLASAALTTSAEQVEGSPEGVTLMTVHTAKGLEWPVVIASGMEDGLFPLSRSMESPEGLEEERRLAYVAMTRARELLALTWARARRRGGQLMPSMPSRFLETLPPGIVDERRTGGMFGVARSSFRRSGVESAATGGRRAEPVTSQFIPSYEDESQDMPRFVAGERVRHRKFGSGAIVSVSGRGRDLKVVVSFDDDEVGDRTLLAAYAGLERDWE